LLSGDVSEDFRHTANSARLRYVSGGFTGYGMRIVSISSGYPNPFEPGLGLFIRSRLLHMARIARLAIVAPVSLIDYSNPQHRWFRNFRIPACRRDEGVEVLHPRWIFPPGGMPVNVLCLAGQLVFVLWRLREHFPFDLIDAHFGYPEGAAAALLAMIFRCPFTITLRGSERMFHTYKYRRMCIRWALRRADAVFAVSEELRRFAVECGANPARVRTVPNGIDAQTFYPRDRVTCRAKFGMHPDRLAVVCAGELIEAKGHHLVIRAIRDLIAEGRSLDLFIAGGVARGGAAFHKELTQLVEESRLNPHVHLTGWLDRDYLADLLSAADVFCLASFTEGWPNVVHEALACGTPVVATHVGATPEMLPGERYGILVPPREQIPLTDAIRRALVTNWDRAAIAAWGRSRSWDDAAREVLEVMLALAAERKSGILSAHLQSTSSGGEI
jgi:teichuronic acid biosynthesis glycosyltransferase TuaC